MITDIRLQNFRLYKDSAFDFDEGVNIIVGPNASGKTTLIEALLVITKGSSFKAQPADLLRFNQTWSKVDAHTKTGTRTVKIKKTEDKALKQFEINNDIHKRLSLDKTIPAVIFEPLHLLILGKRPDLRRDFLDDMLEQTTPGFKKLRRDYKRTLSQRNSLLKKGPAHQQSIFPWNIRLGDLGGQIATHRIKLINEINDNIDELYKKLSNSNEKVTAEYGTKINSPDYASGLLNKLEKSLEEDLAKGYTTYGPHRDEFTVLINDRKVQDTASRGESRTILLALKMLEMQILEKETGQTPILLLDDVFSELDGARRKALTKFLEKYQTFITTTDADIVLHNFTKKSNIIAMGT